MKRQICFLILISSFCIITLGQEVKKVKLIYGSQGVLLPVSAKCTPQGFEQSFYESLNFLTTYDDIFLAWFSFYMEQLIPERNIEKDMDPRIMIVAYRDSLQNDTLYLGESYGILKNRVMMKDDSNFLNLVKRKIGWGISPLPSDSLLYPSMLP